MSICFLYLSILQRSSPVGSSKPFEGPSLLDGQYDEFDAQAEFQAALAEWRQGKGAKQQQQKQVRVVSPVKTPSQ